MLVRVVLPIPVEEAYTYRVPGDLQAEAEVGCRVLVPFGARRLTGMIVAEEGPAEDFDGDFQLKDVLDVLDDAPAFTPEMLRLTRWIADYYVCGWGEGVKAALPAGTDVKTERRLVRTERPVDGQPERERARAILQDLDRHGETTLSALRKRLGRQRVRLADVRALEEEGFVQMETTLRDPDVKAKTERHLRFAPAFRHEGAAKDLKEQLRGHKQRAVIEALAGLAAEGISAPRAAEVRERAEASRSTVRSLLDKGMVEVVEKEVRRSPLDDLPPPEDPPEYDLHPAQAEALAEIEGAIEKEEYAAFLLHGVTGSGKTEVYIAALKAVLKQGRTGIILVPEIALTPQTVQRFRSHFEGEVAVLHSQMSMGERYDAWRSLREGRRSIAIGPRSAVLAPLQNLGLIVVDEEHESSYKQFDPAPRYHARDVAVMRAHQTGAVCVLGSATPSLESVVNARQGKYTLLEMPDRVPVPGHAAAPLPEVEIVDLTRERKKRQLEGALSKPLREAVAERLEREEQVILLHNRRGFAPVIECADCGFAPQCPDCSVSLTYHKAQRQLRCHYCGFARPLPRVCPKCEADALEQLGTGTQRVEEELRRCFPEANVLRMDRDTTRRKNAHHRILQRFGEGEADILLGTQMVAKGLDFSRVTLVGVVNTDVGLLLPDFRAEERTFQLLTQVAGRAGRADLRGEVILQTRNPDHSVLRCAQKHDFEGFAKATLMDRQALGYPPYGRIVGVEFKGPKKPRAEQLANDWTRQLSAVVPEGVEVLGPEPPLIARVKRHYRFQTILRIAPRCRMQAVQQALRTTRDAHGGPPRGYYVAIDVDAVGLF